MYGFTSTVALPPERVDGNRFAGRLSTRIEVALPPERVDGNNSRKRIWIRSHQVALPPERVDGNILLG